MWNGSPIPVAPEQEQAKDDFSTPVSLKLVGEFRYSLAVCMANHRVGFVGDGVAAAQGPVKEIEILPCARWASCPKSFVHETNSRLVEDLGAEGGVGGGTNAP